MLFHSFWPFGTSVPFLVRSALSNSLRANVFQSCQEGECCDPGAIVFVLSDCSTLEVGFVDLQGLLFSVDKRIY